MLLSRTWFSFVGPHSNWPMKRPVRVSMLSVTICSQPGFPHVAYVGPRVSVRLS